MLQRWWNTNEEKPSTEARKQGIHAGTQYGTSCAISAVACCAVCRSGEEKLTWWAEMSQGTAVRVVEMGRPVEVVGGSVVVCA